MLKTTAIKNSAKSHSNRTRIRLPYFCHKTTKAVAIRANGKVILCKGVALCQHLLQEVRHMKLTQFLKKNLLWNFAKDIFADLCCAPTTEEQLYFQLRRLADRYFPQRKKVDTAYTEFCLNEIALFQAKTPLQKCAQQHFEANWQTFLRLKNVFDKEYMTFPSDGGQTRLELIAELVTRCTQCTADKDGVDRICQHIRDLFDLEERESRNLENVLSLLSVKHFCAVARGVFQKDKNAETRLAKRLESTPLKTPFEKNANLRHSYYSTSKLIANVDCLANSATKFVAPTAIDVKTFLYANGKNVFDTFCFSKFGKRTAEFFSQSNTIKVTLQYFLEGAKEVRRYTVENLGKSSKKLVADCLLKHQNSSSKTSFFDADGALCVSVEDKEEFYCALAMVHDNKIVQCPFEEGRLSHTFELQKNGKIRFDLVTVFAKNMPDLAEELQRLNAFGATVCPYAFDEISSNTVNFKYPLHTSSHGYAKRPAVKKESSVLNFTYQLGNENVGTFLDNDGNCTTLINGFAFGIGGEKVFSVKNGAMSQLNCGKFTVDNDTVTYQKPNGAVCAMSHGENKTYCVKYPSSHKTLFYFPLEETGKISFENNTFTVTSKLRKFAICCCGKVESYTTNALECNTERLRYKLSKDLQCGTCLAICFATDVATTVTISSLEKVAAPTPLVRESLVSTYLNYVNDKNAFCLHNFLKRADSLTLAAITFTNPSFVKDYLTKTLNKHVFFYDAAGKPKTFYDRLALPLAAVYYANVTDDAEFPTEETKKIVSDVIFNQTFTGRDLCIKALVLKKAAQIKGFDKVRCLIEYNNLKKTITSDVKLYGYAQAIGAVALLHPSKQRLKDLCNKYQIPQSWYYVSQLENLYGLSLVEGALRFEPKVTQENVLEQLALTVAGKRIDTTFTKAAVQSMTLNGTQYFIAFRPQNLKRQNNTLVVRY